jgi:5-formyltetrahydrofolate cyclo-ligase
MEFREARNLSALTLSAYGILEPQHGRSSLPQEIELYFIPGLAFDRKGNRLGRGGGYYDRYLSTIRPDAIKVGLAYQLQIDTALPVETHDHQVDLLITETGIIPVNPVQSSG